MLGFYASGRPEVPVAACHYSSRSQTSARHTKYANSRSTWCYMFPYFDRWMPVMASGDLILSNRSSRGFCHLQSCFCFSPSKDGHHSAWCISTNAPGRQRLTRGPVGQAGVWRPPRQSCTDRILLERRPWSWIASDWGQQLPRSFRATRNARPHLCHLIASHFLAILSSVLSQVSPRSSSALPSLALFILCFSSLLGVAWDRPSAYSCNNRSFFSPPCA